MEKDLKKLQPLKPKEKEFAKKFVINNENGTQTVKEVYGIKDEGYARLKAHRLITKDNVSTHIAEVKLTLKDALEQRGITPHVIAERVETLLFAKDENGRSDSTAVDKGLKHATTIYGVTDSDGNPTQRNTYNFLFADGTREEIKEIEEKIKARLLMKKKNVEEN